MSSEPIKPKIPGAKDQRHGPCVPTPLATSGVNDADCNASHGKATPQEARAIASLELWLETVKATSKARQDRSKTAQSFSNARKSTTMHLSQVSEPTADCRRSPPIETTKPRATLPLDGWVRIVSNLHISALDVEMWLRIDRYSGYIEEFRIGPKPLMP